MRAGWADELFDAMEKHPEADVLVEIGDEQVEYDQISAGYDPVVGYIIISVED